MCDAPPRSQIMMTDLPREAACGCAARNRSTSARVRPANAIAPTRSTSRRDVFSRIVSMGEPRRVVGTLRVPFCKPLHTECAYYFSDQLGHHLAVVDDRRGAAVGRVELAL